MGLRFMAAAATAAAFVCAAPATSAATSTPPHGPTAQVSVLKGYHLGERPRRPLVIGGTPAGMRYPAVVYIEGEDSLGPFSCSGSKISTRWILTAAHCVSDEATDAVLAPDKLHVAIGNKPISTLTAADFRAASRVARPQNWDPVDLTSDVAVLELAAPVDGWSLQMAGEQLKAGDRAHEPTLPAAGTVVGFGATDQQDPSTFTFPDVMFAGATTIWPATVCNGQWPGEFFAQVELCAGRVSGGSPLPASACSGDSGGPLLTHDALGDWIVGVTSFGDVLSTSTVNVFTRVAGDLTWITEAAGLAGPERVPSAKQVARTETSATVSVTAQGLGADGLLTLVDVTGHVYDGVWVHGEGPQTAMLKATGLLPGSNYYVYVTGDSFYAATASKDVALRTDDLHKPALLLRKLVGARGKRLAIRVHVSDNSRWFGFAVSVLRGRRVLRRFTSPVGAPLRSPIDRLMRWRVPLHAKPGLRVCAHAFDSAGNASRPICRPVRLLA